MLVNLLSVLRFAHRGVEVVEYQPGPSVNLPADAAEFAIAEGMAEYRQPEAPEPPREADEQQEQPKRRRKRG